MHKLLIDALHILSPSSIILNWPKIGDVLRFRLGRYNHGDITINMIEVYESEVSIQFTLRRNMLHLNKRLCPNIYHDTQRDAS